jgi:ParB/RepB/Spo0J family partition protein
MEVDTKVNEILGIKPTETIVNNPKVVMIPLTEIHADDNFNSRGKIIPMDVIELAQNIEKVGLIQPIIVMEYKPEDQVKTNFKYKLIAGFRRRFAFKVLERTEIPAIIHEYLDDARATIFNLSENLSRRDLTVLQEARAIRRLTGYAYNEAQIGEMIGKSRGWVQIRIMLLQLPEEIQGEVETGVISQQQIRELYTIFRASGKASVFEAVKTLKDAKILGKKGVVVDPNKLKKDAKRVRTRGDIICMLDRLYDASGPGLHTRVLSWCSGEISDNELYQSVKEYCEEQGKTFTIPA